MSVKQGVIHFKLVGFRGYVIRKGLYGKEVTIWMLGKKLNELEIPTEIIDYKAGATVKRKVSINTDTVHIGEKSVYTRSIAIDEVRSYASLREAIQGV